MKVGDRVQLLARSEMADDGLYAGHPGLVVDVYGDMVTVSFVAGHSVAISRGDLSPLADADYIARGRRVVQKLHPLEDRPVWTCFEIAGDEWPEGGEPPA